MGRTWILAGLLLAGWPRPGAAAVEPEAPQPVRRATPEQAKEAQAGLKLALQSMEQQDWDTAFALLNHAIGKKPDAAEAYLLRGVVYVQRGERAAAMSQIACMMRYGLLLNPSLLGEKELTPGFDRVIMEYYKIAEKTEEQNRRLACILILRGVVLAARRQYDQVLADMRLAKKLAPDAAEVFNLEGYAHLERGEKEEALIGFQMALALKPDYHEALFHRGCFYLQNGSNEKALADFNAYLQACPDSGIGYFNRGLYYQTLGKLPEALADLNRSLALLPDDTRSYTLRASLYMRSGDYERALADYEHLLNAAPNQPNSYLFRSAAHLRRKDYDKAWADVKKCRELGGKIPHDFLEELEKASGRTE